MNPKRTFEFFLLRYVPNIASNDFVNIAVLLIEPRDQPSQSVKVRFTDDWSSVRSLDPAADIDFLRALEPDLRARLAQDDPVAVIAQLRDTLSNYLQLSTGSVDSACSADDEIDRLAAIHLGTKRRGDSEQ